AALSHLPGVAFMPEATWGRHTRWLTTLTIDPVQGGIDRQAVAAVLDSRGIESRPVWKPMHLQPIFAACEAVGGEVAERLFREGLCLPSGSNLAHADRDRVIAGVLAAFGGAG
ncbi:MAG: DegT/DnrJ/EryC1/StrS family aminotransferase, partial [Gemmatimonadales bacterium]